MMRQAHRSGPNAHIAEDHWWVRRARQVKNFKREEGQASSRRTEESDLLNRPCRLTRPTRQIGPVK